MWVVFRQNHLRFENKKFLLENRSPWVAQSVERLTLDFGSGHDLTVREFEPRFGLCADSAEPA